MNEEELVSIIVPVYDSEKFLTKTIDTVLSQSYNNWELIFVNDCSKDNGNKIIEEHMKNEKRIKLINLEKNSGAAVARNKGIEYSKGRYIAFLDADDLWKKDKLRKQLDFMSNNNYEFTFSDYEFADENGNKIGKIVSVPKEINYKQALKNTTIFTSTVIFDVEKLGKELIMMPNVRRGQDTATWWKVLKTGITAHGINESLAIYRRSNNTLSSNKIKALKRTWNLYRNVENISLIKSIYYFLCYVFNAIRRRV